MTAEIEVAQGTEEWHAQRVGKITCSKFDAVLSRTVKGERKADGKDYLIRVALERIAGKSSPVFETWQMRQGTEREHAARRIYEVRADRTVDRCGFITHPLYPFAGGSPDGTIGSDGGLEIKCPELEQHLENLTSIESEMLPEKYRAQVQGCIWVMQTDWHDFCTFNPDFPPHLEFACLRVERDDDYIKVLEIEVLKFEEEVCALVDRLMKMNGGPIPAPMRLRDLEFDNNNEAQRVCTELDSEGLHLINDDFDSLSWLYQRSELHGEDAFHIFRRGDETTAVPASEEWVKENQI